MVLCSLRLLHIQASAHRASHAGSSLRRHFATLTPHHHIVFTCYSPKPNDMETLPFELHEQIFANLLTHVPRARRIESPTSNESERRGVYNLRLTSHQLYEAGWQALLQMIEDVPTHCSVTGLRHLAALAELLHVSSKLTCLTLNTCKLICTSSANYEAQSIEARAIWLQDVLKDN